MSKEHVGNSELLAFAADRVNLPKEEADEYRAQARRLRERLESYLGDHPDFTLRKMLLSGSLAKGLALKSLNDIDVAMYVSGADAPHDTKALLKFLAEKLRTAFPNFSADQVQPKTYSVTVSFKGTGLDVDIVPILYSGDPDWRGNLVSQDDGSLLETSIPMHLAFTRARKEKAENFAQTVRLAKFWARRQKAERDGFRFKSFMIELVFAHLCDLGVAFDDYAEGLQHFFTYLAKTNAREKIIFSDYYKASAVEEFDEVVQIIDPVNPANNVSRLYKSTEADAIVEAALEAGDAIDAAMCAPNKTKTIYYWQKLFGPAFQV